MHTDTHKNLCPTIWKASKRVREAHEREKRMRERERQMREGDERG